MKRMKRTTPTRLRSQRGISLLEVLSALSLFSVVAVGLSGSTITNMQLNTRSRTIAAATALLQNKVEQIRLTAPQPNVWPADLIVGTHHDPANPLTALDGSGGSFTRRWEVTRLPQYNGTLVVGSRPAIVKVEVTVSWAGARPGSVRAVTYACTTPNCG